MRLDGVVSEHLILGSTSTVFTVAVDYTDENTLVLRENRVCDEVHSCSVM